MKKVPAILRGLHLLDFDFFLYCLMWLSELSSSVKELSYISPTLICECGTLYSFVKGYVLNSLNSRILLSLLAFLVYRMLSEILNYFTQH